MRFRWFTKAMVFLILGAVPCAAQPLVAEPAAPAMVEPDQVRALMQAGAVVLDVRTPAEFATGHLPKAINLDVRSPEFEAKVAQLDRAATYLVYCRTQNRSRAAAAVMRRLGFQNVNVLSGGFAEWARRGLPTEQPPAS